MNIFYQLIHRLLGWKQTHENGAEWGGGGGSRGTNAFKLNHWLQWEELYLGILGKSMTWGIEKKIDFARDAKPLLASWWGRIGLTAQTFWLSTNHLAALTPAAPDSLAAPHALKARRVTFTVQ